MLTAPLLRRRITPRKCVFIKVLCCRSYANAGNGRRPAKTGFKKKGSDGAVKSGVEDKKHGEEVSKIKGLSLYEQLFPDQRKQDSTKQPEDEIPRLPVDPVVPERVVLPRPAPRYESEDDVPRSYSSRQLRREMIAQGTQTTVLVLRSASKNLVEEDFKRLIPQGKHLDGWTLEEGDILRVIPGRDLNTLARAGYYYLLFSSPLSAFTYQGHATRIHRMVTAHTPASVLSAIPPPPGYMIEGMDAHAAIESFSLTAPTQSLDLRQLKPPLSREMESIVKHGGYAALMEREDRMPHEARLTLDGPQLHISALRHILLSTGRDRGLGWSGGDDLAPRITKWEPPARRETLSPTLDMDAQLRVQASDTNRDQQSYDASKSETDQQKRRTPQIVYIAGFKTERAMQSFVHFWHQRRMEWQTGHETGIEEEDLAPIANVEVLW